MASLLRALRAGLGSSGADSLPSPATHSYLPPAPTAEAASEAHSEAADAPPSAPLSFAAPGEVPLFPLDGVVLFPGETLPLRIRDAAKKALIGELVGNLEAPPALGVLLRPRNRSHGDGWVAGAVGTFAEVVSVRRPAAAPAPAASDGELVVVCRGATRFRVVGPPCRRRGVLWATVAPLCDAEPVPCAAAARAPLLAQQPPPLPKKRRGDDLSPGVGVARGVRI